MCNLNALQQNIAGITKDGYDIAIFLADTMRGETPGVKVCHRMEAAKHLIKYGFTDTDCNNIPALPQGEGSVEGAKAPSPSTGEGWDGGEDSPPSMSAPVTHIDILNYEIAHLVRHESADGHTIVNCERRRHNIPRRRLDSLNVVSLCSINVRVSGQHKCPQLGS